MKKKETTNLFVRDIPNEHHKLLQKAAKERRMDGKSSVIRELIENYVKNYEKNQ